MGAVPRMTKYRGKRSSEMVAPERIGSGLVPTRHKPAPPAQRAPGSSSLRSCGARVPARFRHSILSVEYKTLRVFPLAMPPNKKGQKLTLRPFLFGGSGENRTLTPVRIHDFESCASTNSATEPWLNLYNRLL